MKLSVIFVQILNFLPSCIIYCYFFIIYKWYTSVNYIFGVGIMRIIKRGNSCRVKRVPSFSLPSSSYVAVTKPSTISYCGITISYLIILHMLGDFRGFLMLGDFRGFREELNYGMEWWEFNIGQGWSWMTIKGDDVVMKSKGDVVPHKLNTLYILRKKLNGEGCRK